ncbi:hypothetical protein [Streptomyces sp. NPDC001404]|uniref:hypothetical protein n=1 Tax=Streptomyces sp. NPDC001404 TaxID=3364571 RepID=UPI0036824286
MTASDGGGVPSRSALPEADWYHLTVRFSGGPAVVEGTWAEGTTALRKFSSWVGSHGNVAGVVITLEAEIDGVRTTVRQWPDEPPQR